MDSRRPLSPQQARVLTDRIVATPKDRWARIAEVHARAAAPALGYPSWAAFCESEFGPERFRIPPRERFRILTQLKNAGMSFEDVEAAVIPRTGSAPVAAPPTHLPAPLAPAPRDVNEFGFSAQELDVMAAVLDVDDDEFRRILTTGRLRGDLSASFVLAQCRAVIAGRDTFERNLERALRSVERAQELLGRTSATGGRNAAALDLIKLLGDHAWELIDSIDRVHGQLDQPG